MKKCITNMMCALAALAGATACESIIASIEPEVFVLEAQLPGDTQTKTTLGAPVDNVYEVLWKTGDKISVNGLLSNAVSSADNGKKNVEFTVSGSPSAPFNVLYPGTSSSNVIALPATQNYVANSFDGAAAAAYGIATRSGSTYNAKLHNFCGVLRFALNGSATLDRIELNSLGSEKLRGNFTVSNFETGAFSGGTAGTLTYNIGGVTLTGSDTYFYIAIPAQTYASGIEALVYQNDGAFMRLVFWSSGVELERNKVAEFVSKTYVAGRTENVLEIGGLTAENGGEPSTTPPGLTVAFFNTMRFDEEQRPADAIVADNSKAENRPANAIVKDCAAMRTAFGQVIKNTGADIIGFNEIGETQYASGKADSVQDLAEAQGATGYTWKIYASNDSGNHHFDNGFAYKSSVVTLQSSGRIWLRTDNTSPYYSTSTDSYSGSPKTNCVWAKFTHKDSGTVFWLFVTQLPTKSHGGNLSASKGMNAYAAYKAGSDRKILVGDMNSADADVYKDDALVNCQQDGARKLKEYWTDAYEAVQAAGNLSSFYATYSGTQSGTGLNYQYPILTFCKNHPERRIDHIMTNGNCSAQTYKTIRNTYSFGSGDEEIQCYPSDHLALVSYIILD